jgi:hypothetical protein
MTVQEHRPITFRLAKWYAYIFAATFVLYGAVSLILAVLDRNYVDLMTPLVLLVAGILLVVVSLGYRDLRHWGWFALVAVNGLVVLRALFSLSQIDYVILGVLSIMSLACLFAPPTRTYLFGSR